MTEILQPDGWKRPSGYSNAVRANGEMIFIAGQIGWDANQELVSNELIEQTRQALKNIVTILSEASAEPKHLVRLTWYVTDIAEYQAQAKSIGEAYRDVIGLVYPAMSLFEVSGLVEKDAKVEIEATAVLSI